MLDRMDYPLVVIGVDPGGTTGVSVVGVRSAEEGSILLDSFQWGDPNLVAPQLIALGEEWSERDVSVVFAIEQFDKRPGIVDPDYTSMYIIRDIERDMEYANIYWFTPSQTKNLIKPAKRGAPDALKRFGFYRVNMNHANDASRAALTFMVEKLHHMPTILKGWPKRG